MAASMRRAATVAGLSCDARKPVDTCADYPLKYAAYLQYDHYLPAGCPIATEVIEGACRYLVRDRMKLTGARWRLVSYGDALAAAFGPGGREEDQHPGRRRALVPKRCCAPFGTFRYLPARAEIRPSSL